MTISITKKLLIIAMLPVIASCSLMDTQSTMVQRKYTNKRDYCRDYSEDILNRNQKYFTSVRKTRYSKKEVKSILASIFSDCMFEHGWAVATPKKQLAVAGSSNVVKPMSLIPGSGGAVAHPHNDEILPSPAYGMMQGAGGTSPPPHYAPRSANAAIPQDPRIARQQGAYPPRTATPSPHMHKILPRSVSNSTARSRYVRKGELDTGYGKRQSIDSKKDFLPSMETEAIY